MSSLDIARVVYTPIAEVSRPRRFGPGSTTASAANASDHALSVDAIPSSPPAEVLDAIAAAAHAYERLKASGRGLRFETDEQTRRVSISVRDPQGSVMDTISPSMALDVATTGIIH